jgi:hypothetical protein
MIISIDLLVNTVVIEFFIVFSFPQAKKRRQASQMNHNVTWNSICGHDQTVLELCTRTRIGHGSILAFGAEN